MRIIIAVSIYEHISSFIQLDIDLESYISKIGLTLSATDFCSVEKVTGILYILTFKVMVAEFLLGWNTGKVLLLLRVDVDTDRRTDRHTEKHTDGSMDEQAGSQTENHAVR